MFAKYDNPQRKYEMEQTEFIKIKPNRKHTIPKGLGHSKIPTNNFSRRNSVATIVSSVSSTDSLLSSPTATSLNTNYEPHSQQSWSMPHLNKNIENIANEFNNKNNYKLTEQRCNYERIVQHQLRQQLLQSTLSKQVLSSRISSFSAKQNQPSQMSCITLSKDFLDLSEFRIQNSKDCFSEHRQQECFLQRLPAEQCMTTQINNSHKLNCKELKMNGNTFKNVSSSSSSIPYAIRQRMLRDEQGNDLQWQNKFLAAGNKSLALSYQKMY